MPGAVRSVRSFRRRLRNAGGRRIHCIRGANGRIPPASARPLLPFDHSTEPPHGINRLILAVSPYRSVRTASHAPPECHGTSLNALRLALGISVAVAAALAAAMLLPLNGLLNKYCPSDEAVRFWSRFTLVMMFLSPLFVSLVWGLPSPEIVAKTEPGALMQRLISTNLVGAFLAMLGMGVWVSSVLPRGPQTTAMPAARGAERWGESQDP